MKITLLFVLLAASAVFCAEEKKQEKRGVLGLGYGAAPLGLYNHGLINHGLYNHGVYSSGLYGHGYGAGLYGHGYSGGLIGHGYGAGLIGHGYGAGLYGHGLYGAPWLGGLGHGYLH